MIFKNQHGLRRISPAAVELKILAGFMEFVRHLGESGVRVSIILASALERKICASWGAVLRKAISSPSPWKPAPT